MENQTFIIEDELKKLPGKPGVYLMHGEKDVHRATTAANATSPLMAIFFIAFVFLYLSSVS